MNEEVKIEENIDINQALKEFEEKSEVGQEQKAPAGMIIPGAPKKEVEGINFETDNNWGAVKYYHETTAPKMVNLLMKYSGGAIKGERQAEWLLLGFVIVAMAISFYLFFGGVHKTPTITPAMLEQMKQMQVPTTK